MSAGLPPLNWLRAFEASARHLSFTRAAADLNLTATAVSYQVRSLEQYLNRPLFERLPRGLRLTEMGAAYLPDLRRAFEDIAATTTKLFGHSGSGKVTVRAPVSFLTMWLAPRLHDFQEAHPDIDILLLSTVWADAQPDPSVDIDIRFGTGNWPGYAAELLLHENSVVVGAPDLIAQKANRQRLEAALSRGIVHVVGHETHWAEVCRRLGATPTPGTKNLRSDNSITAVSLAASVGGAAIVLRPYAEWAIETMKLVRLFDFTLPLEQAHYVLSPLERKPPKRDVLLFREWVVAHAEEERF